MMKDQKCRCWRVWCINWWIVWIALHNMVYAIRISQNHYSDVIMGTMASQITNLMIIYLPVYSGGDQRKHQSPASLAFVRRIHWWPVNSPHKGPARLAIRSWPSLLLCWWSATVHQKVELKYIYRWYNHLFIWVILWPMKQIARFSLFDNVLIHGKILSMQITFWLCQCQVLPMKYLGTHINNRPSRYIQCDK